MGSIIAGVVSVHAQSDDWMRHFRIGGSVMMNVKTDFKTSGTFQVNRPAPSAAGGVTYDDGFVGVDATGNAGGTTTFWGYNSASQFDSAADRLTYHGTDSYSTAGSAKADDYPLGFDMVYAGTFRQWEHVAIGGEAGFGFNIFDSRDRRGLSATVNQTIDQYDTGTTVLPTPPYSGPQSGSGAPVIGSTPVSSTTQTVAGTIGGSRTLDGILYNFRLGPTVRWEFYPRWTLNGSAGGVLGIFDAEYHFNETVTTASSTGGAVLKGKFGSTDFKPGGYAGAVVMWDSGNEWELFAGANFMAMGNGKLSSGGREATMHLDSAVVITAGINWTF